MLHSAHWCFDLRWNGTMHSCVQAARLPHLREARPCNDTAGHCPGSDVTVLLTVSISSHLSIELTSQHTTLLSHPSLEKPSILPAL